MSTATYALPANNKILNHAPAAHKFTTWLADGVDDKRQFTNDDALAASGDYFITLATALDKIAQNLPRDGAEQIEIENLVSTLFYLQKHYVIIAKHKLK